MRKHSAEPQRGQSMSEFLVALVALIPLFLAVSYAGRYSDIHFTTVQASRYAAMERIMQPDTTRLPDARLQDEVRARFFVHGSRNQGLLRSNDTASRLDGQATTPLWRDMAGNSLLPRLDSARLVTSATVPAVGGPMGGALNTMAFTAGKSYGGATSAHLELGGLVNRMDQRTANPPDLSIGATTSAMGDSLGSSGSAMTRDAAARLVPTRRVPAAVNRVVDTAFSLFERTAPIFGCIKPDVVPVGRLDRAVPSHACQ
jgi:hypothetical protein